MIFIRKLVQLLLFTAALTSVIDATADNGNQLADHPSPYLAMHASDPVNWRSWQGDVFAEARARNQLVLVSVGYFSCHWCHVMQRQSYRHPQTADFLNRHFLAVKVDRELQPDLDRRLIEFVRQVRGVAGWPLNVFLTPEGYPLTGFTYLPQPDFLRVLQQLDRQWQTGHVAMSATAREYFDDSAQYHARFADLQLPAERLLGDFITQTMQTADVLQGGLGDTSKFPNVPQMQSLLDSLAQSPERADEIAEFIRLTLDNMAALNLQDHVNGGFFRYTTDPDWQTPHFEKMLYDNAMLASLYLQAERLWPAQGYADTALRTLDFIETGLRHPRGGYMSSVSAVDRDNREGGAYLWSSRRLEALLSAPELEHLQGRWQQQTLGDALLLRPPVDIKPADYGAHDRAILRKLRRQAELAMPVDNKRLASWNAMMLSALTLAADFDDRFESRARIQFSNMRAYFFSDSRLLRLAANADVATATFEDYANTAQAFLRFGERFQQADAIRLSRQLTEQAYRLFFRDGHWQSAITAQLPLMRDQRALEDQVLLSPQTLWLATALTLPELDAEIRASASKQLNRVTRDMFDRPYFYGSLILLRVARSE